MYILLYQCSEPAVCRRKISWFFTPDIFQGGGLVMITFFSIQYLKVQMIQCWKRSRPIIIKGQFTQIIKHVKMWVDLTVMLKIPI